MAASKQGLVRRPHSTLDTVQEALGALAARYRGDEVLTSIKHIPAREADFRPMPAWVRPELAAAYRAKGIDQLYSHQARSRAGAEGKNLVVVTPTASGKTLCYNLPVLNACCDDPGARALYLFPHQGPGRGSARRVPRPGGAAGRSASAPSPTMAIRRRTRARPSASAATWCSPIPTCCTPAFCRTTPTGRALFENLRYIVIDELHYYRGVYGSHLANVLRRLEAALRILRIEAAVHLLLGHHRQSAGAGRGAHRTRFRGIEETARRAARNSSSSTIRRW